MDILVATLTQHRRPAWLDEARASVPPGIRHLVMHHPEGIDFNAARWCLAYSAEFVAWLDDDDRLLPGALEACIAEFQRDPTLGVVFTHEARIDARGDRLGEDTRRRTYRDVAMHPRELHHLAVVRSSALGPDVLEHAQRIGVGIDWLMRASAALRHGALQVPMVGYEWRSHPDTLTERPDAAARYEAAMPALRAVTRSWMKYDAPIRQARLQTP